MPVEGPFSSEFLCDEHFGNSDFIGELFLRGGIRDFEGLPDFLPKNLNNFHG